MAINLQDAFAVQQQLNDQQQQSVIAQTLAGSRGDLLSTALARQAMVTPQAPNLRFDTPNANGIGTGIVSGLGNVFNNALQMRQFSQQQNQQRQAMDLLQQQDMARQEADLAKALNEKAEKERNLTLGNNALAVLSDPTATPAQRLQAFQAINQVSGGDFAKNMATNFGSPIFTAAGDLAAAPNVGQGEALKQTAKVQTLTDLLAQNNVDINTPQGQNLFRALMDFAPTTQADVNIKQADASIKEIEAQSKPMLTAQQIEQNNLNMQSTQLGNVLKNIEIRFEPERLRASIEGQQLDNKEKADKLARIETAMKIFDEYNERLARGEVTPEDIISVQSNIGMLVGLDPGLDTNIKSIVGLKPGDKLEAKHLQGYIKQFTQPPKPVAPPPPPAFPGFPATVQAPGDSNPFTPKIEDLSGKLAKAETGAKKAGNQAKQYRDLADAHDKSLKSWQAQDQKADELLEEANQQMQQVDALLKKYGPKNANR